MTYLLAHKHLYLKHFLTVSEETLNSKAFFVIFSYKTGLISTVHSQSKYQLYTAELQNSHVSNYVPLR